MWTRPALALLGLVSCAGVAAAQDFHIEEAGAPKSWSLADLKPGTIKFSDHGGDGATSSTDLVPFQDWGRAHPNQKKFLILFPGYGEDNGTAKDGDLAKDSDPARDGGTGATKDAATKDVAAKDSSTAKDAIEPGKFYMYVAQARFLLDRAPEAIDLSRYATLSFLEKIDPAIKHTLITAADVKPFKSETGTTNDNPDRKWCTGRNTSICIQSTYKLEGKIPIGILLVNKLRDSAKKVADHIDFQSELSALPPADLDQDGLKALTGIDAPVAGVLEQNCFYVNEILHFAKFYAVFQADPNDTKKTVVTAFMAIAIEGKTLDKKRDYENVPVLRNLVPAQVLMGQSSFNSGTSISAGLPKYARNEIATIAGLLAKDPK